MIFSRLEVSFGDTILAVGWCNLELTILKELVRFIAESRESGKSPKNADDQADAQVPKDEGAAQAEFHHKADGKCADDIYRKGLVWEVPPHPRVNPA